MGRAVEASRPSLGMFWYEYHDYRCTMIVGIPFWLVSQYLNDFHGENKSSHIMADKLGKKKKILIKKLLRMACKT